MKSNVTEVMIKSMLSDSLEMGLLPTPEHLAYNINTER